MIEMPEKPSAASVDLAFAFAKQQARRLIESDPDFFPMFTENGNGGIGGRPGPTGARASCPA